MKISKTEYLILVLWKRNLTWEEKLGIMENSTVIPLFTSPFGDPSAYLVKNAVVALRNNDCKDIIVTPE